MSWQKPKPCYVCQELFNPSVSHQLNCSDECGKVYKKQKQAELAQSLLVQKECVMCGKSFLTGSKHKTCSKPCSKEWRKFKQRRPPTIKNCAVCQKEFRSIASAKTCGPECSYVYKTDRAKQGLYRKNREPIPCAVCEKIFKPSNSRHIYCSRDCWELTRKQPLRTLNCEICSTEFKTHNGFQKFCSAFCQQKAKVDRARKTNWAARGVPLGAIVKCKICNFNFKQKHSRHIYCSPSCNADAQRHHVWQAQQNSPQKPRSCLYCKQDFMPKTRKSMAKFCSSKCRGAYATVKREAKIQELEEEKKNQEALQKKWDDSSVQLRDCPQDSQFKTEIWEFLKGGGSITKYLYPVWAAGAKVDTDQEEVFEL